jgi:enoyl-[acyl-carrier protein] reductase I
MSGLLEGKKVLVTGVLDRRSIAYSAARLAAEQGAEVVLSSFGRARSLTERTAKRLDPQPPILELDVNKPEDIEAVAKTSKSGGARSTASSTPSPSPPKTPSAATS